MIERLDPGRLRRFCRHLARHPAKKIPREVLWEALFSAFPDASSGGEQRRWLHAALKRAAREGVITFPARRGQRWDRSARPHLPTSVNRVADPAGGNGTAPWRSFPWRPELAWVSDLEWLSPDQLTFLKAVHRGLVRGAFGEVMPLEQRSLRLLGDEKALGGLRRTSLFGPGRLTLDLLGCRALPTPLVWERLGTGGSALVFENAAGFSAARGVLAGMDRPPYGLLVYGAGNGFVDALPYLATLPDPATAISYVGDLDGFGLQIAQRAQRVAREKGLPSVEPATEVHLAMFDEADRLGHEDGWPYEKAVTGTSHEELAQFVAAGLRDRVVVMLRRRRRVPEEVLTPRCLQHLWQGVG